MKPTAVSLGQLHVSAAAMLKALSPIFHREGMSETV